MKIFGVIKIKTISIIPVSNNSKEVYPIHTYMEYFPEEFRIQVNFCFV